MMFQFKCIDMMFTCDDVQSVSGGCAGVYCTVLHCTAGALCSQVRYRQHAVERKTNVKVNTLCAVSC